MAVVLLALLSVANVATATVFTTIADQASNGSLTGAGGPYIGPDMLNIKALNTDAATYVNTYDINAAFPNNAGDKLRTIVAAAVTSAKQGGTYNPCWDQAVSLPKW